MGKKEMAVSASTTKSASEQRNIWSWGAAGLARQPEAALHGVIPSAIRPISHSSAAHICCYGSVS
jgi:hypothetical protein